MIIITIQVVLVYSFRYPDGSFNLRKGYAVSGALVALFLLTPAIILLFTVTESKPNYSKRERINIWLGLKITLTNFAFVMVLIVSLFYTFFYICKL